MLNNDAITEKARLLLRSHSRMRNQFYANVNGIHRAEQWKNYTDPRHGQLGVCIESRADDFPILSWGTYSGAWDRVHLNSKSAQPLPNDVCISSVSRFLRQHYSDTFGFYVHLSASQLTVDSKGKALHFRDGVSLLKPNFGESYEIRANGELGEHWKTQLNGTLHDDTLLVRLLGMTDFRKSDIKRKAPVVVKDYFQLF